MSNFQTGAGRDEARQRQDNSRTIAIVIIAVAVLVVGGGMFLAIVIPGLLRARASGHEASAIGSLRAVSSAQATFAASCANGLYAGDLPTLGKAPPDAPTAAFATPDLTSGPRVSRNGYDFWIEVRSPAGGSACNGATGLAETFVVRAEPTAGARRYFAVTESGTLYQSTSTIIFDAKGRAEEPATLVQ